MEITHHHILNLTQMLLFTGNDSIGMGFRARVTVQCTDAECLLLVKHNSVQIDKRKKWKFVTYGSRCSQYITYARLPSEWCKKLVPFNRYHLIYINSNVFMIFLISWYLCELNNFIVVSDFESRLNFLVLVNLARYTKVWISEPAINFTFDRSEACLKMTFFGPLITVNITTMDIGHPWLWSNWN
jgi:hypothetical protein